MKYSPKELISYLDSAFDVVMRNDSERLKSDEFSRLCLDLMIDAKALNLPWLKHPEQGPINREFLDEMRKLDTDKGMKLFATTSSAMGVIAASPFLSAKDYRAVLHMIGGLLEDERTLSFLTVVQDAFRRKADAMQMDGFRLRPDGYFPFDTASVGYTMACRYVNLQDQHFVNRNIQPLSEFVEKLEKSRDRISDWDQYSPLFKDSFLKAVDYAPDGRKDPYISKVLTLTNDGSPLVSSKECEDATETLFLGLWDADRVSSDDFRRSLDVLDDHTSFYEAAFQPVFLDLCQRKGGAFMDHGFRSLSDEGRVNFSFNLQSLLSRLQGRVADPKIVVASFLLGTTVVESLALRDRAKGNQQWLEHNVLDRAREPRMLRDKSSSLSTVLTLLLSTAKDSERAAFWDSRREKGFYIQSEDNNHPGL